MWPVLCWNGRLSVGRFDPIAETLELFDHSGRSISLGLLTDRWTSFLVANSLVQNLPDQAAKPVGNHADRLIVPEARHIPTIEDLEEASFVFDRGIGRLIEDAAHLTVALRRPIAVAYSRGLVIAGARADR